METYRSIGTHGDLYQAVLKVNDSLELEQPLAEADAEVSTASENDAALAELSRTMGQFGGMIR